MTSDIIVESTRRVLPEEGPLTYASAYREGLALLAKAGISNAMNEALWLLESALSISRLAIHTDPDTVVDPSAWSRAQEAFRRRVGGEPLQYILGTQIFRGLDMAVQPSVLIPRPETELLVEEVHSIVSARDHFKMADVGTGSGCLSIALAIEFPESTIFASDYSESAIEVARSNARRHSVQDRIIFLAGDLLTPLEFLSELHEGLSVMVANPPYIPTRELFTLQAEVRDFEPHLALDGGPDGLTFYRRLLRDALVFLKPGGFLVMEMGRSQAVPICEEAERLSTWQIRNIRQDDAGIDRVICLERKD